jgi:peroxiredoxin
MTMIEELEKAKAQTTKMLPPEALLVAHEFLGKLAASGILHKTTKVGELAPDFKLPSATGEMISSKELLAKGPLIINFYRGSWWPFCKIELEALKTILPEIKALNANIVAISPETKKLDDTTLMQAQLGYNLISDKGNIVAEKFGLKYNFSPELSDIYKNVFGLQLPLFNGDDSWSLPMPARYVVDQKGIIRYEAISLDYTNRPEPALTIEAIKGIK